MKDSQQVGGQPIFKCNHNNTSNMQYSVWNKTETAAEPGGEWSQKLGKIIAAIDFRQ